MLHARIDELGWTGGFLSEHRHRYWGRGSQVFTGVVNYERYGLPDLGVCVQGDLKAVIYGQARRLVETTFFG
jgi:hypothetical protein